jgi:hypothetical protein
VRMGLAGRDQGARRRRCGDIVDDDRDRPATPMRPMGSGGAWASAALALLDDVPTAMLVAPVLQILGSKWPDYGLFWPVAGRQDLRLSLCISMLRSVSGRFCQG